MRSVIFMSSTCILLVIFGYQISCRRDRGYVADPNVAAKKLSEYSQIMNIEFPSSVRLLNFQEQHGLDMSIYLKINLNKSDLQALLSRSPFANRKLKEPKDNPIPFVSLTGPNWWNISSVKKWKSGQASLPDAQYLNILIDFESIGNKVIIYLEWHET